VPNTKITKCVAKRNVESTTLRERAALVLRVDENASKANIAFAYRKLVKQYHPDMEGGDADIFRVISEAYALLTMGKISRRPLLSDDELVSRIIGTSIEPLVDALTESEKYKQWHKSHFYGVGVV